jgi:hypothetical protein
VVTACASTFARPDVLVALGAGLVEEGRTELEALAGRLLAERVADLADRAMSSTPPPNPGRGHIPEAGWTIRSAAAGRGGCG